MWSDCARQEEPVTLEAHVARVLEAGAGEVLINSIDRDGTIVYADYVPDQMQEPDYGKAVAAARAASA